MTSTAIIPRLGIVFRDLVTRAGYRNYLVKKGLDRDLDDLANENPERFPCELLQKTERQVRDALEADCGADWGGLLNQEWRGTREAIQFLAQRVDTTPLDAESGLRTVRRHFVVPMLSGFVRVAQSELAGPVDDDWWQTPFAGWLKWMSATSDVPRKDVVERIANHLDVDDRTVARWEAGEAISQIRYPFRPTVAEVFGDVVRAPERGMLERAAGWLMVSVAFQSLPPEFRDAIRRDLAIRPQDPWDFENAVQRIGDDSRAAGETPLRDQAISMLNEIQRHFATRPWAFEAIGDALSGLEKLVNDAEAGLRPPYQYIHDWFAARLAAISGRTDDALATYRRAAMGSWWCGGMNQAPLLSEALQYAVGVGDLVNAKHYWDMTFLLGLNRWPKRPLDEQERRRLAFGFEKKFAPQKAKDRIPPAMEVIVRDGEFQLTADEIKNPNRKVKFAEGRTRRTPLMVAVMEGALEDVKRLIAEGGDPNDFIPESGEGPISYALRRACDRRDPLILSYLLDQGLSEETVNREFSTMRETPLKLAIEMADAAVVQRLIELGADTEARCDYLPSALCYATVLLYQSMYPNDRTQEAAYFSGLSPADRYDAKAGAVLDCELSGRRSRLLAKRESSLRNREMWEAVKEHFSRPAPDRKEVVSALLRHGANPNRRYKVSESDEDEWTPTLFAAQVGDLDVFADMVSHGGDPDLTLARSSEMVRNDALWIAIAYSRHSIFEYLVKRPAKKK